MVDREPLDVLEAIHSTPARRYLGSDPIPDEILWELLDAAIRGPTGGNSQSWGWVVIRDEEKKATIANWWKSIFEATYGKADPSALEQGGRVQTGAFDKVVEGETGLDASGLRSVTYLANHIGEAPVLIVPVLRDVVDQNESTRRGLVYGGFIFGAIQNLALAARAYGIGAPLTTFGTGPELDKLLDLPEGAASMAIIPLGYPVKGRFSQPRRMPVEQVVHFDTWGSHKGRS
ncbi:MAG: nitroreductase [Dehalococcoidia bacterium]|nr:nitroreductase [Dehalococcoidia bacterium]|tara:strand:+ start:405 stop:1100 length:696 start_codon:yes stop_codon:yes gene_type:complete